MNTTTHTAPAGHPCYSADAHRADRVVTFYDRAIRSWTTYRACEHGYQLGSADHSANKAGRDSDVAYQLRTIDAQDDMDPNW